MSDEALDIVENEEPPAVEAEAVVESESVSEEDIARAKGWVPPEEYEGDKTPVSAGEFLRKEPLLAKIAESNKRTRALESTVKQLIDHNRKLAQATKNKQLDEVNRKKLEAVEFADPDGYKRATEEESRILSTPIDPIITDEPVQFTEDEKGSFDKFKQKHGTVWANQSSEENKRMLARADAVYGWAAKEHPDYTVAQLLTEVEKDIKFSYPHRFKSVSNSTQSSVESAGRAGIGRGSKGLRFNDLDDFQKKCCKEFVAKGVLTEKEYLDQIAAIKQSRG